MNQPLLQHFDLLATAPGGVARLRELILTLAVRGKLVPQDPSDEPASVLLQKIRAEKDRLIAEGKIKRDKPLAQITDEEKSFELPQGWEWSRGGGLFAVIRGVTYQKTDARESLSPGHLPLLRANNIRSSINFDDLVYVPQGLVTSDQLLQRGDFVVCLASGSKHLVGKAAAFPGGVNCSFGAFCGAIRPWQSMDYLAVYLASPLYRDEVSQASAGIGINNLKGSTLLGLCIPVPPAAEQSRIVARVEELMRLCDALEAKGKLDAEQHAQLLRTLLGTLTDSASPEELAANWLRVAEHFDLLLDRPEAVDALEQTILQLAVRGLLVPQDPSDEPASVLLQKIRAEKDRLIAEGKIKRDKPLAPITEQEKPFELPLGWEWVRLNAMLQKIGAGSTPRGGKEVYVTSGVKFLRSQNVWDDGLRLAGVAFIRPETHAKMSGTVVVADDLLFNITGASIGRCAVVPSDFDEANVSQHVTIVRSVLPAINAFLHKVLVSQHVQQAVMAAQVGVSREGLSIAKLGNFLIPVPPLAEQSRIVARVEELRQLCAGLRQRLTASRATQGQLAQALVETAL